MDKQLFITLDSLILSGAIAEGMAVTETVYGSQQSADRQHGSVRVANKNHFVNFYGSSDVLRGFEDGSRRAGNHVNHGDEMVVAAVTTNEPWLPGTGGSSLPDKR